MDPEIEWKLRAALQDTFDEAAVEGMPPEQLALLQEEALGLSYRRRLTGDPPSKVEPTRVV